MNIIYCCTSFRVTDICVCLFLPEFRSLENVLSSFMIFLKSRLFHYCVTAYNILLEEVILCWMKQQYHSHFLECWLKYVSNYTLPNICNFSWTESISTKCKPGIKTTRILCSHDKTWSVCHALFLTIEWIFYIFNTWNQTYNSEMFALMMNLLCKPWLT